jgi:hypothetical protein
VVNVYVSGLDPTVLSQSEPFAGDHQRPADAGAAPHPAANGQTQITFVLTQGFGGVW